MKAVIRITETTVRGSFRHHKAITTTEITPALMKLRAYNSPYMYRLTNEAAEELAANLKEHGVAMLRDTTWRVG